jgi:hypothetical protein
MDHCTDGANLLVDDVLFHANSVDVAKEIFQKEIIEKI